MRQFILLLACLTVLLAGCSTDPGDEASGTNSATTETVPAGTGETGPRERMLVARKDIDKVGRNSPAAAVLTWWQALQYQDPATARQSYVEGAAPRAMGATIRELGVFLANSRPTIVDQYVSGDRARVLVLIRSTSADNSQISESPATFQLRRDGGRWRLADNLYLENHIASQRAASDTTP
jgi:hypothetical protein